MAAGIGATNAHRLWQNEVGKTGRFGTNWRCTAQGCDWRPLSPASEHGSAREQFTRHLYELVPKGRP